jgi:phospholipid transport system substrate-binding protein
VAVLALGLFGAATPVSAAEPLADDAVAYMKDLSQRALDLLTVADIPEEERESRFRALFRESIDVPTTAKFVLGRYWRTASDDQRQRFTKLFEDFVVIVYLKHFRDYTGEKLEVFGGRVNEKGNGAIVDSEIILTEGPPIRVSWAVQRQDGGLRIVDIIAEGVSLAITHRSEFGAVIRANGGKVDALINALQTKTASLSN